MASTPTLRQKNEIYKKRSLNHSVASKASETKVAPKAKYSYWAITVIGFALFGGAVLQIIDLFL